MCYRPIHLRSKGTIVPCNKCPKCKARRVSSWSFRLQEEEKVCTSANFITLTYDTNYVPISSHGYMELSKDDLQKFFKRLRKSSGKSASYKEDEITNYTGIKYYAVGEYGGQTARPHYHIIMFNAMLELIDKAWRDPETKQPIGNIHYGKVEPASIGYCLKYMLKNKKTEWWNTGCVQPEFNVMSKGLGISYLDETMCNWHIGDMVNRMYCNLKDGKKISMPRYYKEKLYYENERSALSEAFQAKALEMANEKFSKQSFKDVINEQKAIDAAFDRMYFKSQKHKV